MTIEISEAAYDNLRQRIIGAHQRGTKSRVNAEAQLAFIERYRPALIDGLDDAGKLGS